MRILLIAVAAAGLLLADNKLGKPLNLSKALSIDEVMAEPAKFVGSQVQIKGKVTEVCQMAGCWMALVSDSGKTLRVKVNDGDIVFPKSAIGKMAVAEGLFEKKELTKEQAIANAKHEAEENNRPFNPASVKGPTSFYRIWGSGAVIQD
jgi:hypothetical protein